MEEVIQGKLQGVEDKMQKLEGVETLGDVQTLDFGQEVNPT